MEQKSFIKITDRGEWQNLLNKVLFKTFFHNKEWEEFLERQFNWLKFERYLYRDKARPNFEGQNLGGQALLSLVRARGKLISHPFCEYGGPLPLVEKIDGEEFQKELFEEFKTPLKISFHPQILNYFDNLKFPENQRETYFFDNLGSRAEEDIWQAMDRNRHRSINSAQAENFQIEECQNLPDLKCLYHFYVKNLKRHQALAYPLSFFIFFFQNPQAKIYLVKKGKQLIGGNLFLFYDKIAHSFLCGFSEKDKKMGAHSLVLWEAIKKVKKEGCEAFDLGAVRKDSPLRDFKERWGAKSYPIFELKNYSGQSGLRKSKLRIIYGSLPLFLIKKLSPHLLKFKL